MVLYYPCLWVHMKIRRVKPVHFVSKEPMVRIFGVIVYRHQNYVQVILCQIFEFAFLSHLKKVNILSTKPSNNKSEQCVILT